MYIEGNTILEKYWIMSIKINLICKTVFDNQEKVNASNIFLPGMVDLAPMRYEIWHTYRGYS